MILRRVVNGAWYGSCATDLDVLRPQPPALAAVCGRARFACADAAPLSMTGGRLKDALDPEPIQFDLFRDSDVNRCLSILRRAVLKHDHGAARALLNTLPDLAPGPAAGPAAGPASGLADERAQGDPLWQAALACTLWLEQAAHAAEPAAHWAGLDAAQWCFEFLLGEHAKSWLYDARVAVLSAWQRAAAGQSEQPCFAKLWLELGEAQAAWDALPRARQQLPRADWLLLAARCGELLGDPERHASILFLLCLELPERAAVRVEKVAALENYWGAFEDAGLNIEYFPAFSALLGYRWPRPALRPDAGGPTLPERAWQLACELQAEQPVRLRAQLQQLHPLLFRSWMSWRAKHASRSGV